MADVEPNPTLSIFGSAEVEPQPAILAGQWQSEGLLTDDEFVSWLRLLAREIRKGDATAGLTPDEVDRRLALILNCPQITRPQRWCLLRETVQEPRGPENATWDRIRRAVLAADLELAYVSKKRPAIEIGFLGPALTGWRLGERLNEEDLPQLGNQNSLLLDAAKNGVPNFVSIAVRRLTDLLNHQPANGADNATAILRLANKGGISVLDLALWHGQVTIIQCLLEQAPLLADQVTQKAVIDENWPNKLESFRLLVNAIKSQDAEFPWAQTLTDIIACEDAQLDTEMAKEVVSVSADIFNGDHASAMIRSARCTQWWSQFQTEITVFADSSDLMSVAIKSCRCEIVESLISTHAELLVKDDRINHLPPLAQNTRNGDEEECRQRDTIEEIAVDAIIARLHDNTAELRRILSRCNAKEICFDLGGFTAEAHSFKQYVTAFKTVDMPRAFQKTLAYARFPDLDGFGKPRSGLIEQHYEVEDLLSWLNQVKGVKKIVKLVVQDDWDSPLDEQEIGGHVDEFQVEILNWRRKDLAIAAMARAIEDREREGIRRSEHIPLRELHLHSSGLQIALDQWFDPQTYLKFPQLKEITIHTAENRIHDARAAFLKLRLEQRIENWQQLGPDQLPPSWPEQRPLPTIQIGPSAWVDAGAKTIPLPPVPKTWVCAITDGETFLLTKDCFSTTPLFPQLKTLLDSYRGLNWAGKPRVKVAIIDNGISPIPHNTDINGAADPGLPNGVPPPQGLSKNLKHGNHKSFVRGPQGESPWWVAEEAHGTWMANLITAIDPRCALYIARVCTGKVDDIRIPPVIEAVKWAKDEGVDIISMSFALYDVDDVNIDMVTLLSNFRQAVQEADNNNIVMICSTSDTGQNDGRAYPAQFPQTIGIAGCDYLGNLLKNASPTHADWYLLGSNVEAGRVPFLTEETRIDGSSAATAIAAGLASLTLSCHIYADTSRFEINGWKKAAVVQRFKRMTPKYQDIRGDGSDKYVQMGIFCGRELSDHDDVDAVIRSSFTHIQV